MAELMFPTGTIFVREIVRYGVDGCTPEIREVSLSEALGDWRHSQLFYAKTNNSGKEPLETPDFGFIFGSTYIEGCHEAEGAVLNGRVYRRLPTREDVEDLSAAFERFAQTTRRVGKTELEAIRAIFVRLSEKGQ